VTDVYGRQVTPIDMVPETRTRVVSETVQILWRVPVEERKREIIS
jgi:hypothetical protein